MEENFTLEHVRNLGKKYVRTWHMPFLGSMGSLEYFVIRFFLTKFCFKICEAHYDNSLRQNWEIYPHIMREISNRKSRFFTIDLTLNSDYPYIFNFPFINVKILGPWENQICFSGSQMSVKAVYYHSQIKNKNSKSIKMPIRHSNIRCQDH